MLMELTVIPLGRGRSLSGDIAELIGLIDDSGLPYKATEFGTLIEGSWEQLMGVAKKCHTAVRNQTDRVQFGDAPACNICGALMVRSGSCHRCLTCGSTSGCS